MKRPLAWVAAALGITIETTAEVTGWSIDSRTLQPGDLFFALRGPSHDGHAYIAEVFAKGAGAVVADHEVSAPGPVLVVPNTLQALQQLASAARIDWGGDVIGVTGSAGKTTTKDVIAALLAGAMPVAKNEGNLNNHFGLPLSILRIPDEARAAVLEMGMNHAGEIRELCAIARPRIGVVTNAGWAHIENFEDREGIAAAKRELIESLGPEGIAVLNGDDPRVAAFAQVHSGPSILYGLEPGAHVQAENVRYANMETSFVVAGVPFVTRLTGRHSVRNILAGIAVAGIYGIAPERLIACVAALDPGKMRGERSEIRGITVLNDCYNSNPDAARAMLEVLRDTPGRRRIAVLGEMLELGKWSETLHRDVGAYAAECGIDVLIGIRGAARHTVDAAHIGTTYFFENPMDAGRLARKLACPGDVILFKGSRGVRVELALQAFTEADAGGAA